MNTQCNSTLDRAVAFKREGRYDEAIVLLRELVAEDPHSTEGHHELGLIYGFIGMYDESIDELKHAVTLAPARVDVRNDLALTYSMLSMYDEARSEFEEVLRRDPQNKRALDSLRLLSEPV